MSNQHRVAIAAAASTLLGLCAISPAVHAADAVSDSAAGVRFLLAQTGGMERRDDRQENRDDRQDTRDECRDEEGAGKDKRDCKQEGRREGPDAGNAEGDAESSG